MLSHHAPPHWPQFYLTRVIGTSDLPDVEILTLPDYRLPIAISDLKELQRQLMIDESFQPVRGSDTRDGADVCFHALYEVITDIQRGYDLPMNYDIAVAYANQIFSSRPVPVMNSPLSGSTLLQMTASAGSGAAFMMAFRNADVGHVMLFFLLIGGTRIVIGAADGVSNALKLGLSHILLKWMGVHETDASPTKREKADANHPGAPRKS